MEERRMDPFDHGKIRLFYMSSYGMIANHDERNVSFLPVILMVQ